MRTDFAQFLAWSQARDISTPLELVSNGSYRYMALPKDQEKLIGQSKSPDVVNIVTAPLDTCIVGEDWETLVEKLKYESGRGPESDYAPWLDLFPTIEDFSGMPRFWTPERRDWVRQYDSGQLDARMERDKMRFDQLSSSKVDQWALAIVDSRSNFLPDNTYAMTPMLDMFNHNSRVKTSARVDGADRFLLGVDSKSILLGGSDPNAKKEEEQDFGSRIMSFFNGANAGGGAPVYKVGTEVFVSYGDFDNLETLCNYGFVDEDNAANIETIRVRMMGKAPAYLVVEGKGSIDNVFNALSLTDLRIALATPEEMESLEERDWNGLDQISDRNELEVFALIAGELEEALYDAKSGAEEAATVKGDAAIASYLRGRQKTLENGRAWLQEKFPDVF